jgi:hypothetical protein
MTNDNVIGVGELQRRKRNIRVGKTTIVLKDLLRWILTIENDVFSTVVESNVNCEGGWE